MSNGEMKILKKSSVKTNSKALKNVSALESVQFTLSVSPALVRGNLNLLESEHIIEKFRKIAGRIHDINFTCRVPPFERDAHGVFITPEENRAHLRQMLKFQDVTGITVSPVTNNVFVPNTADKLSLFIDHLKPLIDMGIRSITVPHVLWMKTGRIQKTFPNVKIKNTVLRHVHHAQDFWNHAEAGYDYVNLDRTLIRNQKVLRDIRRAQAVFLEKYGKKVITSLLHNEGCLGTCPLIDEHYLHTITNEEGEKDPENNREVFRYPQQFSCYAVGDSSFNFLMSVGLPYFKDDLEESCQLFDVIKLAGRRTFLSLGDCLKTIEDFGKEKSSLLKYAPQELEQMMADKEIVPLIQKWRHIIKNCEFQCWRCNMCSEIYARLV